MRDWTLLKNRLPELRLRRDLRIVASYLIEGRTTREIATSMGCTQHQVKLEVALIVYLLGRLPPDGAAPAAVPVRPGPSPSMSGHESLAPG